MLFRKYIQGGIITSISQVNFERIIKISVESFDELKEKTTKDIYIENELYEPQKYAHKFDVSENTKYDTEKGIAEFECINGYVDNIRIEGKTISNLIKIIVTLSK